MSQVTTGTTDAFGVAVGLERKQSEVDNLVTSVKNMAVVNMSMSRKRPTELQSKLWYHWQHYMYTNDGQVIVRNEYGDKALCNTDIARTLFASPQSKYAKYYFRRASYPRGSLKSMQDYLVADTEMTMVMQITRDKSRKDNEYLRKKLEAAKSERDRSAIKLQMSKPHTIRFQAFHPKYFFEEVLKDKWLKQKPLGCFWEGLDTPLGSPVKMFFDFDRNYYETQIFKEDLDFSTLEIMQAYDELPNNHMEALNDFITFLKLVYNFYFGKQLLDDELYITCANSVRHNEKYGNYFKLSYHIVVNNGHYFTTLEEHKRFMQGLFLKEENRSQVVNNRAKKPATPSDWTDEMTVLHDKLFFETSGKSSPVIDLQVYSKSRFFSIPLSYKLQYGEKATHLPLGTWYNVTGKSNGVLQFNDPKHTFWHYCIRLYENTHKQMIPYDNRVVTKYIRSDMVIQKKLGKASSDTTKVKKNILTTNKKVCPQPLLQRVTEVVISGDNGKTLDEYGHSMYPLHSDANTSCITEHRCTRKEDGDGDYWEFEFRFDNPPQFKCAICGYRHTDLNGFQIDIYENGQVKYYCKSENSEAKSKFVVELMNLLDPKDYAEEDKFMQVVWALKGASNLDNEDEIEEALIEWAKKDEEYNSPEHIELNRQKFKDAKRGQFNEEVLVNIILKDAELTSKLLPLMATYNQHRNENRDKALILQTRAERTSLEWLMDATVGGMSPYPVFPLFEDDDSVEWSITVKDGDNQKEVKKTFSTHSNTLMIQANMGVGKTQTLIENLKEYIKIKEDVSILVISYRVLLCNEYVKTFNDAGIPLQSYEKLVEMGKWDPKSWNCVVTCLDSVWKAFQARDNWIGDFNDPKRYKGQKDRVTPYDIVIVDELDSILSHFCSTTITDKGLLRNVQQSTQFFLHHANVVIAMDAYLKNTRCEEFLRMIRHNDIVTCVQNTWVRPTNKKMGVYVTFGNQEGNEDKFIKDICDAVKKHKRICIASMSAAFLNKKLAPILMAECQLKLGEFMFYTGDATMTDRTLLIEHSKNILKYWGNQNYRVVGWSPTITAGVNYQVTYADRENPTEFELKKVFDEMFLYCMLKEEHTCSVWDLLQMSGRVRQLRDTEVDQNSRQLVATLYPDNPKDYNITALLCDGKPSNPHHWTMEKFTNKETTLKELTKRSKKLDSFVGQFVPKQFWQTNFGDTDNVWWNLYLNNLIRQSDNALHWRKIFVENFKTKMNVPVTFLSGGPYHTLLEKLKEHKLDKKDFKHLLAINNGDNITVRVVNRQRRFIRATDITMDDALRTLVKEAVDDFEKVEQYRKDSHKRLLEMNKKKALEMMLVEPVQSRMIKLFEVCKSKPALLRQMSYKMKLERAKLGCMNLSNFLPMRRITMTLLMGVKEGKISD